MGLEVLLDDSKLLDSLKNKRVAYVGHPPSVDRKLRHGLDLLIEAGVQISAAFGPQHGIKGDKQDNMIESEHERDPRGFPLYSLYSEVRRPTDEMLESFDVLLVDMQDVGCRVYTYMSTLLYLMEACAQKGKELWVLDRPNPIGRKSEGFLLDSSLESFVGATRVPLRHGLSMCELAQFMREHHSLNLSLELVKMQDYSMGQEKNHAWPQGELPWVNPSPNVPTLDTTLCYPGTVLLEGSLLSEGRGTTRPLQIFGAPELKSEQVIEKMAEIAPQWMKGVALRPCHFEPTFHKFAGELCSGIQWHTDTPYIFNYADFEPVRLMTLTFRAIREIQPELMKWRQPPYEYEEEKLPIDLLMGDVAGREWIDSEDSATALDAKLSAAHAEWIEMSAKHRIYS